MPIARAMEQPFIPTVNQTTAIIDSADEATEDNAVHLSSTINPDMPASIITPAAIQYSTVLKTMVTLAENSVGEKNKIELNFPHDHIECIVQILQHIEFFRQQNSSLPTIEDCKRIIIFHTKNFGILSFFDTLKMVNFFDIPPVFDALLAIQTPLSFPRTPSEEVERNGQLQYLFNIAHQSSLNETHIGSQAIWQLFGRMLYPNCLHYKKIFRMISTMTGQYIDPVYEKIIPTTSIPKNKKNILATIDQIVLGAYMQEYPELYKNCVKIFNKNISTIKAIIPYSRQNIMIATEHNNQVIQVKTGKIKQLRPTADYINVVALSPNGTLSASGLEANDAIKISTMQSGASQLLEGHHGAIAALAFNANAKLIASGSWDNTLRLWDVEKGSLLHIFDAHTDTIDAVAFNPSSTILASGSRDNTVHLWDIRTKSCISTFTCPDYIYALSFNNDGSLLAAGCNDGTIILWNVFDGSVAHHIKAHDDRITSIAFSPNNNLLIAGSYDRSISILNSASGLLVQRIDNAHTDFISSVLFSSDGTYIMSAGWDNAVRLYGQLSLLQALMNPPATPPETTDGSSAAPSAMPTPVSTPAPR
jgi:hypothetical protein